MQVVLLVVDKIGKDQYRITSNFSNRRVETANKETFLEAVQAAEAMLQRERIRYESSDDYYRNFY